MMAGEIVAAIAKTALKIVEKIKDKIERDLMKEYINSLEKAVTDRDEIITDLNQVISTRDA